MFWVLYRYNSLKHPGFPFWFTEELSIALTHIAETWVASHKRDLEYSVVNDVVRFLSIKAIESFYFYESLCYLKLSVELWVVSHWREHMVWLYVARLYVAVNELLIHMKHQFHLWLIVVSRLDRNPFKSEFYNSVYTPCLLLVELHVECFFLCDQEIHIFIIHCLVFSMLTASFRASLFSMLTASLWASLFMPLII